MAHRTAADPNWITTLDSLRTPRKFLNAAPEDIVALRPQLEDSAQRVDPVGPAYLRPETN